MSVITGVLGISQLQLDQVTRTKLSLSVRSLLPLLPEIFRSQNLIMSFLWVTPGFRGPGKAASSWRRV